MAPSLFPWFIAIDFIWSRIEFPVFIKDILYYPFSDPSETIESILGGRRVFEL